MLKQVLEKGTSVRALARQQGCSPALVQNLVALASLAKDARQAFLEGRVGRKKALQRARQVKPIVDQSHLPRTSKESLKPPEEYAQLIADFIRSSGLLPIDWEMILVQIDQLLYGNLRWQLVEEAPKAGGIRTVKDPWAVIKTCEPEHGDFNSVPDIINHWVTWFARWSQHIILSRKVLEAALDSARRSLISKKLYNSGRR
jgi:hypothetical protein